MCVLSVPCAVCGVEGDRLGVVLKVSFMSGVFYEPGTYRLGQLSCLLKEEIVSLVFKESRPITSLSIFYLDQYKILRRCSCSLLKRQALILNDIRGEDLFY